MVSKPIFLIVPGAWHPPSCYTTLANHLKAAGYPTNILAYPSLNTKDPLTATCAADAESLRRQLIPVIEKDSGKVVFVVCHSYGGIPGGGAAQGLSKSTRVKEGKEG
ncbi:hypothetical protein MMC14_010807, partial [Varicellaria rhodocarpa]|nr:hypothetical protein [Varicellaria rhodocarpa]